ncbi:hypothetical protein ScPMuIL_013540 [Solemya velum]
MSFVKAATRISRSLTCIVCPRVLRRPCRRTFVRAARVSGIWEPDDVNANPDIPEYEILNLKLNGYDFTILESFAKYVHNLGSNLALDTDSWASPSRTSQVVTYRPNTTIVDHKYSLVKYERIVQLQDVPSTMLPIFLEVVQTHMPEGVELKIGEPNDDEEEFRYVPDKQLQELHAELDEIDAQREDRKKK